MSETHEGILRRIALRMGELAREDEWNKRLVMVSDEMLTIASCYEKWLTLNDMTNSQNEFNDFCEVFAYSPSISQAKMYYAVTELREIADKWALEVIGDFGGSDSINGKNN
ncbi:MAG: hypothetical protein OT477_16020 [Chloroflexi bacterium]|nr:hypothetical protein [Chloroflexota bacterium]